MNPLETLRRHRLPEVRAAKRSLWKGPRTPEAYVALSDAYRSAGLWRASVTCLRRAVRGFPDNADLWILLGGACTAAELHPQAEEAYRRALTLQPRRITVYNLLGTSLYRREQSDEAYRVFRTALEVAPDDTAWCGLGYVCKQTGRLEEALAAYEAALRRSPSNVVALCGKGDVCGMLGRTEEMEAAFEEAARSAGPAALPHLKLRELCLERGDEEGARAAMAALLAAVRRTHGVRR